MSRHEPAAIAAVLPRRQAITAIALLPLCALCPIEAAAAPADVTAAMQELFGTRTVLPGRVRLTLPQLADNGNSIPVTVVAESPMSAQDHVRAIHLFAERNPLARVAEFQLGPRSGRAQVSTRIRLAVTQRVLAVAEYSDGSLYSDSAEIVVTLSACLDDTGS